MRCPRISFFDHLSDAGRIELSDSEIDWSSGKAIDRSDSNSLREFCILAFPFQTFSVTHFESTDSNHTDRRKASSNRRRTEAFPAGGPRRRGCIVEYDAMSGCDKRVQ
jgi:hypothetical protein